MIADCLLKNRERSLADFMLLERAQLGLVKLALRDVNVLTN
jgi:hypothetical protein